MQNIKPGSFLNGGKYRIDSTIGQGGFGITYLGEHTMLGRKVAIKEYFPQQYCDRDENSSNIVAKSTASAQEMARYRAKFIKEAITLSRLSHPNIVHILDVFEDNGSAYFVMEYVEGPTLKDMVDHEPLSVSAAISYALKITDALNHIHEKKINHLDIKPANVIVRSSDNQPVLIDFGLAKNYDSQGNQTSATPIGVSRGYAPLEQYTGAVDSFSPESDIYSLGATIYNITTGLTPPEPSTLLNVGKLEYPASIPQSLRAVIDKAMSISKASRYRTATEMSIALKNVLNGLETETETQAVYTPQTVVVPQKTEEEEQIYSIRPIAGTDAPVSESEKTEDSAEEPDKKADEATPTDETAAVYTPFAIPQPEPESISEEEPEQKEETLLTEYEPESEPEEEPELPEEENATEEESTELQIPETTNDGENLAEQPETEPTPEEEPEPAEQQPSEEDTLQKWASFDWSSNAATQHIKRDRDADTYQPASHTWETDSHADESNEEPVQETAPAIDEIPAEKTAEPQLPEQPEVTSEPEASVTEQPAEPEKEEEPQVWAQPEPITELQPEPQPEPQEEVRVESEETAINEPANDFQPDITGEAPHSDEQAAPYSAVTDDQDAVQPTMPYDFGGQDTETPDNQDFLTEQPQKTEPEKPAKAKKGKKGKKAKKGENIEAADNGGNHIENRTSGNSGKSHGKMLLVILILLAIGAAAAVFYFWTINGNQQKPAATPAAADSTNLSQTAGPADATAEQQSVVTDMPYTFAGIETLYTGKVNSEGVPNDENGIIKFKDDQYASYQGEITSGMITGTGVLTTIDGNTFEGTFDDGSLISGTLRLKFNGEYYVGTFKDNEYDNGVWYKADGTPAFNIVNGKSVKVKNSNKNSNILPI